MSDHERCAGCKSIAVYAGAIPAIYCVNLACTWRAPSWSEWDRVMRAANLAQQYPAMARCVEQVATALDEEIPEMNKRSCFTCAHTETEIDSEGCATCDECSGWTPRNRKPETMDDGGQP